MRNVILPKVGALLAMAVLLSWMPIGLASTFILDAAESYLTMAGSSNGLPAVAQASGSFTTSLSGSIQIGQNTVDALRITGSLINHSEQPGPFAPIGVAASFAGQVHYANGRSGYFTANNSHSHLWGALPIVGGAGQYSVDQLKLTFASTQFVGKRPSDQYPYAEAVAKTFNMAVAGSAALTPAGTGYRIEIPISSDSVSILSNELDIRFTGKIVGYSDIDPRFTPEIDNGFFVGSEGWYDPDRRGLARINAVYDQSFQEGVHEFGSASLFPLPDLPARLVQEILGPGMLLPNTLYQVTFDVGNAVVERERFTGDGDQKASVDVYLSLGELTRSGNYDSAGGIYRLDQLSDIPDEEWRRDQSIWFDTSQLTPEQLAQGANLVLQASSPVSGYYRSEVRFANVRIAIVPEPSGMVLALCGAMLGCLIARRRGPSSHRVLPER